MRRTDKVKPNIFANRFKYEPVPVRVVTEGKPFPFVQVALLILSLAVILATIKVWAS